MSSHVSHGFSHHRDQTLRRSSKCGDSTFSKDYFIDTSDYVADGPLQVGVDYAVRDHGGFSSGPVRHARNAPEYDHQRCHAAVRNYLPETQRHDPGCERDVHASGQHQSDRARIHHLRHGGCAATHWNSPCPVRVPNGSHQGNPGSRADVPEYARAALFTDSGPRCSGRFAAGPSSATLPSTGHHDVHHGLGKVDLPKAFLGGVQNVFTATQVLILLNCTFADTCYGCELLPASRRVTQSGDLVFIVFFDSVEALNLAVSMSSRLPKPWCLRQGNRITKGETQKRGETKRQRDSKTETERQRHRSKHIETQTCQRAKETKRQRDTKAERQRQRDRESPSHHNHSVACNSANNSLNCMQE